MLPLRISWRLSRALLLTSLLLSSALRDQGERPESLYAHKQKQTEVPHKWTDASEEGSSAKAHVDLLFLLRFCWTDQKVWGDSRVGSGRGRGKESEVEEEKHTQVDKNWPAQTSAYLAGFDVRRKERKYPYERNEMRYRAIGQGRAMVACLFKVTQLVNGGELSSKMSLHKIKTFMEEWRDADKCECGEMDSGGEEGSENEGSQNEGNGPGPRSSSRSGQSSDERISQEDPNHHSDSDSDKGPKDKFLEVKEETNHAVEEDNQTLEPHEEIPAHPLVYLSDARDDLEAHLRSLRSFVPDKDSAMRRDSPLLSRLTSHPSVSSRLFKRSQNGATEAALSGLQLKHEDRRLRIRERLKKRRKRRYHPKVGISYLMKEGSGPDQVDDDGSKKKNGTGENETPEDDGTVTQGPSSDQSREDPGDDKGDGGGKPKKDKEEDQNVCKLEVKEEDKFELENGEGPYWDCKNLGTWKRFHPLFWLPDKPDGCTEEKDDSGGGGKQGGEERSDREDNHSDPEEIDHQDSSSRSSDEQTDNPSKKDPKVQQFLQVHTVLTKPGKQQESLRQKVEHHRRRLRRQRGVVERRPPEDNRKTQMSLEENDDSTPKDKSKQGNPKDPKDDQEDVHKDTAVQAGLTGADVATGGIVTTVDTVTGGGVTKGTRAAVDTASDSASSLSASSGALDESGERKKQILDMMLITSDGLANIPEHDVVFLDECDKAITKFVGASARQGALQKAFVNADAAYVAGLKLQVLRAFFPVTVGFQADNSCALARVQTSERQRETDGDGFSVEMPQTK
eukprot:Cvel_7440.t1-p1 / transcript=Cvel_7440.t1 / gene=Cvel_7440 / organism=Chromera_velia_CCMP2878 / gene_product=hypothetical protein / transcript_product=hypothetical protein / location=Cvel_scaffold389:257-7712(-) / protein_length=790 / sequence_SO=supercontig / SO=protein_coding / is_pseudo=false